MIKIVNDGGDFMPDNVESMFYKGEMPWHKQGIKLDNPPNSREAIVQAGLNWQVRKTRIYDEYNRAVPGFFATMRSDNQKILGVVKSGYTPMQNIDAFGFFDTLESVKFLQFETAGSIGNGEIVWILARIKEASVFCIHGDDSVIKYLLLSNSHDGNSSVSVKFTPIRVVCQNTLNLALEKGETTKLKHSMNIHSKLSDVNAAVSNILRLYSLADDSFKAMFNYKIKEKELRKYFSMIFPIGDVKNGNQERKQKLNSTTQNNLFEIFESDNNRYLGIDGTIWAAYNAITEYIDHPDEYKHGYNKLLKRIWFGEGAIIKEKAYLSALNLLKGIT